MEVFGQDMIIGDFKLSDYGLKLGSFDYNGDSNEELGNNYDVIEEFVGGNPVPVYLGAKYSAKLEPQITIIKDPCIGDGTDMYFTEHECREILRQLTGFRGYKQMQIYSDEFDELIFFNVRTKSASYKKMSGKVVGIILEMECDSQFGWSKLFEYEYDVKAGQIIIFYNSSDDLYNYLYPTIIIESSSAINLFKITNITDNNWVTEIKNVKSGEIITMDSKNEILQSSTDRLILNDFNMHFFRFTSGRNEIQFSHDCKFKISFKYPRKVGFV